MCGYDDGFRDGMYRAKLIIKGTFTPQILLDEEIANALDERKINIRDAYETGFTDAMQRLTGLVQGITEPANEYEENFAVVLSNFADDVRREFYDYINKEWERIQYQHIHDAFGKYLEECSDERH